MNSLFFVFKVVYLKSLYPKALTVYSSSKSMYSSIKSTIYFTYRDFDELKKLAHNKSNALVTQILGHAFKVLRSNELSMQWVDRLESCLYCLGAPQVLDKEWGRVVPFSLADQTLLGWNKSHGWLVVAEVGENIWVDLVEDVNCNAAIRRSYILIGFFKQRIKILENQILA